MLTSKHFIPPWDRFDRFTHGMLGFLPYREVVIYSHQPRVFPRYIEVYHYQMGRVCLEPGRVKPLLTVDAAGQSLVQIVNRKMLELLQEGCPYGERFIGPSAWPSAVKPLWDEIKQLEESLRCSNT